MIWKQTPLSKFGFKCVMNKHGICVETLCECLCHEAAFDLSFKEEGSPLTVA